MDYRINYLQSEVTKNCTSPTLKITFNREKLQNQQKKNVIKLIADVFKNKPFEFIFENYKLTIKFIEDDSTNVIKLVLNFFEGLDKIKQ